MVNGKRILVALLAATALGTSVGCTKAGSSSSSAAGVSIGGSLGSTGSSVLSVGALAVSLSDLELYGIAFTEPPEVQKVDLAADGSFTLNFSAAASGAPITLMFRYKTGTANAGKEVGVVKFVDSSKTNMNGTSNSSSSVALTGTVSLGALSISDTGEVTVSVSAIASNIGAAPSAFDLTGTWKFSAFDATLPSGYRGLCTAAEQQSGGCNGPGDGEYVYMKQLNGKEFTPDATCAAAVSGKTYSGTCAGTTGTASKYAIGVWTSDTAFASCGSKLGFDVVDAKAYGGIDLTDSGVTAGAFSWTAGYTDGWKKPGATASRNYSNCSSVAVTVGSATKYGWKCTDGAAKTRIDLEGGCTLSGAPYRVSDWGAVTWGSCAADASYSGAAGYVKNVCSGTVGGEAISCYNVYKEDSGFNYGTVTNVISSGGACDIADTTDPQKIAELQCFAEAYWSVSRDADKCIRKVQTNWGTSDPAKFVYFPEGPAQASNQHVLSLLNFPSSGTAVFEHDEVRYEGIKAGANNYVPCKVSSHFKITFKKRTETVGVLEFVSETRLIDWSVPACAAEASNANGSFKQTKVLSLVTKQ